MSSTRSVVDGALARAAEVRAGADGLNAFLWSDPDIVRDEVRRLENEPNAGAGALWGLPVVVKDNIATLDAPTTCGSRILERYQSPFEATVVRRLRAAGAVVL